MEYFFSFIVRRTSLLLHFSLPLHSTIIAKCPKALIRHRFLRAQTNAIRVCYERQRQLKRIRTLLRLNIDRPISILITRANACLNMQNSLFKLFEQIRDEH